MSWLGVGSWMVPVISYATQIEVGMKLEQVLQKDQQVDFQAEGFMLELFDKGDRLSKIVLVEPVMHLARNPRKALAEQIQASLPDTFVVPKDEDEEITCPVCF